MKKNSAALSLGLAVAALAGAPSAALATPTIGQDTSFTQSGTEQVYTVPAGTTQVHVALTGSQSGQAFGFYGGGAQISADIAVTPGQKLYLELGDDAGTYNGGGAGSGTGTPGGGATDVRLVPSGGNPLDPASLASRVLVAGGGGGTGFDPMLGFPPGGNAGSTAADGTGPDPGHGATASAGGAGGSTATAGVLGAGGSASGNSGGGGGGIYGGGGGSGTSGGGAGSSGALSPSVTGYSVGASGLYGASQATITTGPPTLVSTHGAAAFGNRTVGSVSAQIVTIDDAGLGPFTVSGTSIAGDANMDYILNGTCTEWALSCRLAVLFLPTAIGARNATLQIASNDPAGPLSVPLTGTGVTEADDDGGASTPTPATSAAPTITYITTPAAAAAATTTPAATSPVASRGPRQVLLTCHAGRVGGRAGLRCRVVLVPAGSSLPGRSLRAATLANRSAAYGTGTARVAGDATQILLTPSRRIVAGRYTTLTLQAPGARRATTLPIVIS